MMLTVNHLNKTYATGTGKYQVLKDLSLQVMKGEFVAVMGPSGSGKTTLLNCISSFLPYDSGDIQLGTKSLTRLSESELAHLRNQDLGFVFQDFMLFDGLSVFDNICLPQIIGSANIPAMEASARRLLKLFGIEHIQDKYPAQISGGEKQRTAVARALINNPYLILADEPTGNLDSKSSQGVTDAFLQAKKELGATIFMVTHDSYVASFCDRVIVLADGRIRKVLVRAKRPSSFQDDLLATMKELGGELA